MASSDSDIGGSPPKYCKPPKDDDHHSPQDPGDGGAAAAVIIPHKIVSRFVKGGLPELVEKELELMWAAHVQNLKLHGFFGRSLAICNVSGSKPADRKHCMALALLIAASSKPPFDGCIISSVGETPMMNAVNQASLKQKIALLLQMNWGMKINMQAVYNLILNKAIHANLPKDEMLDTVYILSDKEIDDSVGKEFVTDFPVIQQQFIKAGFNLPKIVFWNLKAKSRPTEDITEGNVRLVWGFNAGMIAEFLKTGQVTPPEEALEHSLSKQCA